jgi:hypothetical protein
MPLPVGTWNINSNGFTGTLVIGTLGAPDGSGNAFFQGTTTFTVSGGATDQITGFWDEAGQAISFLRLPSTHTDYSVFQVYTGTLYSFGPQVVGSNDVTTYTLAGGVNEFSINADTATWDGLFNTGSPAISIPSLWCAQQIITTPKTTKDAKDKDKDVKDKDVKDKDKDRKDKEPPDYKAPTLELSPLNPMSPISAADQLAVRVSALEQQIAIGRSFITPEERPAIGGGVTAGRA